MSFYPCHVGGGKAKRKIYGTLSTTTDLSNSDSYTAFEINIAQGETITISELNSMGECKTKSVMTDLDGIRILNGEGAYVTKTSGTLTISLSITSGNGPAAAQCNYKIG